jgi:hypothetical protein
VREPTWSLAPTASSGFARDVPRPRAGHSRDAACRRSLAFRRLAKSFQSVAQAPTDEGEPSKQHLRRLHLYRCALLHGSQREVDARAEVPRPLDRSCLDQPVHRLQEFLEGEGRPMGVFRNRTGVSLAFRNAWVAPRGTVNDSSAGTLYQSPSRKTSSVPSRTWRPLSAQGGSGRSCVASRLEHDVHLDVGAVRGHRGRGDGCLQPEDRAEVEDLLLRPTHDGISLSPPQQPRRRHHASPARRVKADSTGLGLTGTPRELASLEILERPLR